MTIREARGRVRRTNTVLSPALRREVRSSLSPRAPWAARFAKPSRTVSEAVGAGNSFRGCVASCDRVVGAERWSARSVGSAVEVRGSLRVLFSLVYWALRPLLELLVLHMLSEQAKEIEILVLRHQLQVLERQVMRPRFQPTDGENPGWGYTRIQGQLVGLGIALAASTVWMILREAGIEPAPRRLNASWTEFLRRQAASIIECDFLTVDTLFFKRFYILFFIELASRRVHLAGISTNTDGAWVTQQARNVLMRFADEDVQSAT